MRVTLDLALTFAASFGIGLLVGVERERNPHAKAGVRTFALIAVLGTLCALLAREAGSGWVLGLGLAIVGAAIAGAYFADPRTTVDDSGTTTVIAALTVYGLGALNYYGERALAVALGVGMTALLYFKAELEGTAQRLTARDIRSMLQFGAVSLVVLPLLPNEAFGPYGVLNPFHIWLMVVLVSGVSLAGYVAWRLTLARKGLVLTGLLGGLVSSTATTLVYARHARQATHTPAASLVVIVLANATMLVRVLLIVAIVAPRAAPAIAVPIGLALLAGVPAIALRWRSVGAEAGDGGDEYRNPTNLLAALAFGALYAAILVVSAWLSDRVGAQGVYGLAVVSGLTDVDAITLSALQLFNTGTLPAVAAATAVSLAVGANLVLKSLLVYGAGGRAVGLATMVAFAGPLAGLAGGVTLLRWPG
ncbi:MAG: MgtC/SapB family protein [Burkholderiaceae bacterium]